ncbi:superfamily II DNA/RNA helicases, SNF2 family [Sporolactobacillus inulinus]|uniref:Superfamily II DNA/RNA helicases, SNF2 family n=1 Tax=Sporolactobacillus inulinus TaxID=2078 RepID=A0A4Y1Z843_9BACL|nr:superfamily II DNA/RNA helicases, SNF2 family [Sporolactobacillus inulinus]
MRNEEKLKALVNQVMVRNRREDTGLRWPKRIVKAYDIPFSMAEKAFYDSLFELKERGLIQPFSLLTLQREACSSREAVFTTLNKIYKETARPMNERLWHPIFEKMNAIKQNAKSEENIRAHPTN